MKLKILTTEDLACWIPRDLIIEHLADDWTGTAMDLLQIIEIPPWYKLWAVFRAGLVDTETIRLFADWSDKYADSLVKDALAKMAVGLMESYGDGPTTDEDLKVARRAAYDAALAAGAAGFAAGRATAEAAEAAIAHVEKSRERAEGRL